MSFARLLVCVSLQSERSANETFARKTVVILDEPSRAATHNIRGVRWKPLPLLLPLSKPRVGLLRIYGAAASQKIV